MPRPILATIHSDALRHNLSRIRAQVPNARVWAVVKANAYGHGIENVYDALRGADGFAVLDLAEAQNMVMTARIMLGWVDPEELLDEEAEVSEDDAEQVS